VIAALFVRGPGWDDTQPTIVAQEAFPGHLEWVAWGGEPLRRSP